MNGKSHEEKAAITIQARVRGYQIRKEQVKVTHGITKLQALQRGRYTRREYAKLVHFQQQQETFLEETKRRQMRIWQQEQELYFLQHTSASKYIEVRDFQKNHGAKIIQRKWRSIHPTKKTKDDQTNFDPFIFQPDFSILQKEQQQQQQQDKEPTNRFYGTLPTSVNILPTSLQDMETYRSRRKFLEERIKQSACEKRQKEKLIQEDQSLTMGTSTPQERKRHQIEKIQQLLQAQQQTKKRLDMYKSYFSSSTSNQKENDQLYTAQLCASVENRLQALCHPVHSLEELENLIDSKEEEDLLKCYNQEDFLSMSYEEKKKALDIHNRLLQCATKKKNWWQTFLAGEERDIRTMYAISPWNSTKKVWQWPMQQEKLTENPEEEEEKEEEEDGFENQNDHIDNVKEIREFFGYEKERPKDDVEVSKWWKAHASQDAFDETEWMELLSLPQQQQIDLSSLSSSTVNKTSNIISPEVILSPNLYHLLQTRDQFQPDKYLLNFKHKVSKKTMRIVSETWYQMELNTQQKLSHIEFQKSKKNQKTRQEKAAQTIQKHFRGLQGRKKAKEIRAEYFVLVKGRAIRKGKCEECGDASAVLECRECIESTVPQSQSQSTPKEQNAALHFCPNCWVHVHSTRRRKNHVAYPMTTSAFAPAPPQSNGLIERMSCTGRSFSFRASRLEEADTADSNEKPTEQMSSSLRINADIAVPFDDEKKPSPSKFQLLFNNKEPTPEKPERSSSPQLQKPKELHEPAKEVPSTALIPRLQQREKRAMTVRIASPKSTTASASPRRQTSPNSSNAIIAAKNPLHREGERLLQEEREEKAARMIQKARRLSRQKQKTCSSSNSSASGSSAPSEKIPSCSLDQETAATKIQRARRLSVSRRNEAPSATSATGSVSNVSSTSTQPIEKPNGSPKKGVSLNMDRDTAAKIIQRARRNSLSRRTK